jgi:pseudouridine synthase
VGRLDAFSHGALLLSNDGDLTLSLTHPRFNHSKRYLVWIEGNPNPRVLERWSKGVPLDGIASRPVFVALREQGKRRSLVELEMREGRHRQIRRTAELLGHPVLDLQRLSVGPVQLGDLQPGAWRWLSDLETSALANLIDPPEQNQEQTSQPKRFHGPQ